MIPSSASNKFTIGKNRALPEGTVIVRTVVPPTLPARNQTRPLWLTAANCPVVSVSGFSEAGVSKTHCHQRVARCEAGGYWATVTFATIVKASAKAPVLIFIPNVVFISDFLSSLFLCRPTPTPENHLLIVYHGLC